MAMSNKSVPSKKALAKLGLTTENLIDSFLGPNGKEELSYDELLVFWDGFGAPTSAVREQKVQMFGRELLSALMQSIEDKRPGLRTLCGRWVGRMVGVSVVLPRGWDVCQGRWRDW